jgi:hypothetical protein
LGHKSNFTARADSLLLLIKQSDDHVAYKVKAMHHNTSGMGSRKITNPKNLHLICNAVRGEAMSEGQHENTFPLEEAIRAQKALRELAGLAPEMFPVEAFVGMISDEVEILRKQGHSDEEIAQTIEANSRIAITAADIATNYASPEERHRGHD